MEERNDLEELARELFRAKAEEAQAKEARVNAEIALAEAIGGKSNGSTSARCGSLTVTVKRGYNYRIDEPAVFAKEHPDYVRVKYELRDGWYEKAKNDHPELFAQMAQHVTATPKKVSVELKA